MEEWRKNLTREEVEKMQAQGTDVSELWQYVEANEAKEASFEQARFTMEEINPAHLYNPTNIDGLQEHLNGARDEANQFLVDTIGKKPRLFGKGKREEQLRRAELLLTSVVQCHPTFWTEYDEELLPALFVIVYSLEKPTRNDVALLKKISLALNEFRDMDELSKDAPKSVRKLYKNLNDPESRFTVILDDDILQYMGIEGSADTMKICVDTLSLWGDLKKLPNQFLPTDGIIPMIQTKDMKSGDNVLRGADFIPAKYYQA